MDDGGKRHCIRTAGVGRDNRVRLVCAARRQCVAGDIFQESGRGGVVCCRHRTSGVSSLPGLEHRGQVRTASRRMRCRCWRPTCTQRVDREQRRLVADEPALIHGHPSGQETARSSCPWKQDIRADLLQFAIPQIVRRLRRSGVRAEITTDATNCARQATAGFPADTN